MAETIDAAVLNACPPPDEEGAEALLAAELEKSRVKLVVLDDDPTGVQTVHHVSVYTDWSPESIAAGFAEPGRLFYLLTNSRGFTAEQTVRAHREIARTVLATAAAQGKDFLLLSRSDSTLRGHYPLETAVLREELERGGMSIDGEILCPFFPEGGRYTLDNIHYVRYGDTLVPAGDTEFARDPTFGYRSSDLREYVEEKTGGAFRAEDVVCISLEDLRAQNLPRISARLRSVTGFGKVVVNALSYTDLKVFAVALYRVMAEGKRFLFRTAAALVKVMGGVPDQPLLTRRDMIRENSAHGGIVVVGSHTRKTTAQLQALLTLPGTRGIEFQSDLVLAGDKAFQEEIQRVVSLSEDLIRRGITPVCYTCRELLTVEQDTREQALVRSVKISDGVQSLVGRLSITPAFVLAKGGITSSDVGTRALGVKRATVMGQIRPGIPVWQTGPESRFPGIPYVIFPGNVGEESTLREAVEILLDRQH